MSLEREEIYNAVFRGVELYIHSVEGYVFEENKFDLLQKVSALTDAVVHDKLSLGEAVHLLTNHIEEIRDKKNAPPAPVKGEQEDGAIKF
jgi:hypothetical protein